MSADRSDLLHMQPGSRSRPAHGAASELRACAALMDAGYYVYRAEAPKSPFDLAAYKDGVLLRVEVKSLSLQTQSHAPTFTWPRNDDWDLLMVVADDHVFCFEPATTRADAIDAVRVHYGFLTITAWRAQQANSIRKAPWEQVDEMTKRGCSVKQIMSELGVSESTVTMVRRAVRDGHRTIRSVS